MDDIAIKVDHVSKSFKLPHEKVSTIKSAVVNFYRRKRTYEMQEVLKDVSFEVKKGEFFGIVGRNGSGKSTLLKMLAGTYTPTQGQIKVNGSLTPFIELGVGFNPELTGRENVFLNGALLGFNRTQMQNMYADIVSFAELEKFMDQKLKNYSSGMQVRLAFSIAIRANSDILLLDEVLAVGDANFQQKCYNYFEELRRKKQTIVFVSHDMAAVTRFCTKAIYIKDGEMIAEGKAVDIADIYAKENITKEEAVSLDDQAEDDEVQEKLTKSKTYSLKSKVISNSIDEITLEYTYFSKTETPLYIGISVARDGISIGEITTPPSIPLRGKGSVRYVLSKNIFNTGAYTIGAGLFSVDNRELVAISQSRESFTVKREDKTRGAYVRLEDTWIKT